MGKNLGNIPKQEKMTEEQEQTFTNGINKGRKLEREQREAWLNRVRTWYPEKAEIWIEGYETAVATAIKALDEADSACAGWAIAVVEEKTGER